MTLVKSVYIFMYICLCLPVITASAAESGATDLQLQTSNGKIRLKDLRGQVVYVDFWASWCGPCRKSFPWMNRMQARYGKHGFKVVAVNVDSDSNQAKVFLDEHKAQFTVAFDPQGKAATAFDVKGMPNSFLIDRQGNIHSSHIGFREKDAPVMEKNISALLKK